MKRIAGVLVLGSVLVATAVYAAGVPPYKCQALGAGKTVTIDGDLSDWRSGTGFISSAIELGLAEQVVRGGTNWQGSDDSSATMFLSWTKDYLLIGADVTDDAAGFSANGLPNGDNVSVTIDVSNGVDPNSDNSLSIDCTPYPPDSTWESAVVLSQDQTLADHAIVKAKAKANGLGYTIEVAIPWTDLVMKTGVLNPLVTKTIPAAITLADCDENGGPRKSVLQHNRTADNPAPDWYKGASSFGELVFEGAGAGTVKF